MKTTYLTLILLPEQSLCTALLLVKIFTLSELYYCDYLSSCLQVHPSENLSAVRTDNFLQGKFILREKVNRVTNIILFISTGLQCSESIWFHGEHFLGRKDKFLWEESSRISEVRSNEQKVIYYIRTCIQNRWKFLNLFRVYHKNGERILFKKNLPKIWTESHAYIEVVYISMLLSTLHK